MSEVEPDGGREDDANDETVLSRRASATEAAEHDETVLSARAAPRDETLLSSRAGAAVDGHRPAEQDDDRGSDDDTQTSAAQRQETTTGRPALPPGMHMPRTAPRLGEFGAPAESYGVRPSSPGLQARRPPIADTVLGTGTRADREVMSPERARERRARDLRRRLVTVWVILAATVVIITGTTLAIIGLARSHP